MAELESEDIEMLKGESVCRSVGLTVVLVYVKSRAVKQNVF